MADFNVVFQERMEALFLKLMAAVEVGVVAGTAAGEAVGGAQGAVGGVSAQQGSSQQHTGASHKNDVGVPEFTESYNLSGQNDNAHIGKVNARTFDMVSGALTLAMLGSGANMYQQQINQTTHADEEFSARKRATVISLVTVGDAVEEGADDTDKKAG